MSDLLTTSRPSSSTSHHADTSDVRSLHSVHSHGTASPAILTPVGTPPCGPGPALGASSVSTSSHFPHTPHHPSHLGHAHPHPHGQAHQLNTGRWNPFSETRLQQLLSPFDVGSGWRTAHADMEGDADADLEGIMRKMNLRRESMGAATGHGLREEAGAGGRFEKRAMSHGAKVSGLTMTGLAARARDQENRAVESGQMQSGTNAQKVVNTGEEEGAGKGMARRQSMPEPANPQIPLRRPSLSFLSTLSMSRPSSFSQSPTVGAHSGGGGSAISESPAPSTHPSPAIRPSSAAPHSSHSSGFSHAHDLKPLSEIPSADLGGPALPLTTMQRSKTMPTAQMQTQTQVQVERRHFDPCREPKLLHFM